MRDKWFRVLVGCDAGISAEWTDVARTGLFIAVFEMARQMQSAVAGRTIMGATRRAETAIEPPLGSLERTFIDEFLAARHYDRAKLMELPERDRVRLLKEACAYASARLAEVESRSHLIHDIHED